MVDRIQAALVQVDQILYLVLLHLQAVVVLDLTILPLLVQVVVLVVAQGLV